MRKFTLTEKKLLFLFACTIIFYCSRFFFVEFIPANILATNKEISSERKKLIRDLQYVRKSQAFWEQKNEYFKSFTQNGSEAEQSQQIIDDFKNLAEDHSIDLNAIDFLGTFDDTDFKIYSFNVAGGGKRQEVYRFLYRLEAKPHFLEITEFNLRQDLAVDSPVKINLVVNRKSLKNHEKN